jgi:hypothetical protein
MTASLPVMSPRIRDDPEQFQQETGIRPLLSTDLARDTGITDEEFIAETGTDQEGGVSLAASAPPPD